MNNETYISLAKELRHIAVAEAKRYLQDAEDVEDVAKEVMLRIWERREGVIPEKKMMYSYTATLVRNICLDKEKKKRRHPILRLLWYGKNNDEEKECDTLTFDTPHRRMELSETANLYLQALNKLPYTWQRILLMRGEEEKSYAEIAEILGTSDSSVRATLCKAKKKIMQYLNHDL
ncbi:sigma-70 family RNA polymerase sigma factor [Prevotella sp. CAG:1092]|nr:sigma-70 family RNA polymerase sigma factor [Prevotella sp. CAG:1092]